MEPRSGVPRSALTSGLAIVLFTGGAWLLLAPTAGRPGCGLLGKCASNLRQIHALALLYAREKGTFPTSGTLREFGAFLAKEGASPELLSCPAAEEEPVADLSLLDARHSSYAFPEMTLHPGGTPQPLASDKYVDGFRDVEGEHSGHGRGLNVVYTNGSVRWMEESELTADTKLPPGLVR